MTLPANGGQTFPPIASQSTSAVGGMVPTYIGPTETFTIPQYRQGLYCLEIEIDAGGSLVIDGFLVEVD